MRLAPAIDVKNIRRLFDGKKPKRIFARDLAAINDMPRPDPKSGYGTCVNQFLYHG